MSRLTSKVFDMVHLDRTVVVLLYTHTHTHTSVPDLFCNSISIITNCMYANNITAYINNLLTFF